MPADVFVVLREAVGRVLATLGLKGVIGASAVVSTLTLFWWGYRLSSVVAFLRTASTVAVRYGAVSVAVLAVALAGALHAGVIPGVNLAPIYDLLDVLVETVSPSGGGGIL
ncbi:hypothetical protein [Halorussus marinus]|uniref:hypothetical protein n=1 Tax=Halorussus marinus TaxID=2505976 RepID=UPI0010924506|nr:hypothetical protein [Halorussus marinus]